MNEKHTQLFVSHIIVFVELNSVLVKLPKPAVKNLVESEPLDNTNDGFPRVETLEIETVFLCCLMACFTNVKYIGANFYK